MSIIDERAGLPESSYNSSLRQLRNEYPNTNNENTYNTAGLYQISGTEYSHGAMELTAQ